MSERGPDLLTCAAIVAAYKVRLAGAIAGAIARKGWTQSHAASTLGLPQPRLSLICRGKVDSKVSIDLLLSLALRLELTTETVLLDAISTTDTHPDALRARLMGEND